MPSATPNAYTVVGRVIFVQERRPVTIERAEAIRAIHLANVSHWLEQNHLSPGARTAMARIEQGLADEMAAAIRSASTTAVNDDAAAVGVAA